MFAFVLCSLLPVISTPPGHGPAWMSAWNGPAGRHDQGYDVVVDPKGRAILIGSTESTTSQDIAVVAYDLDGQERWSATWNGPGNGADYGWTGAVDSKGRVYVLGEIDGSDGSVDTVILAYSASGTPLWTYTSAGADGGYDGSGGAYAITVDHDDNVLFSHYLWSNAHNYDIAVVKLAPNGVEQWRFVRDGGWNSYDAPYGIETDLAGNVYVQTTSYNGNNSSYDMGALKLRPTGELLWWTQLESPDYDLGYSIAVDRTQNVYIAGLTRTAGGSEDILVGKLAQNGSVLWTRRYDAPYGGDQIPFDVAIHPNGGVVLCGPSQGGVYSDIFTLRYDALGNLVFADHLDSSYEWLGVDSASAIDCDAQGNIFVTGFAWTGLTGGFDGVNLKYRADGVLLEENRFDNGLGDNEIFFGMAISGSRLYAAGAGNTSRGDTDTLLVHWTLPTWYDKRAGTR